MSARSLAYGSVWGRGRGCSAGCCLSRAASTRSLAYGSVGGVSAAMERRCICRVFSALSVSTACVTAALRT
eukprot:273870-Rhodomonas_salina.1